MIDYKMWSQLPEEIKMNIFRLHMVSGTFVHPDHIRIIKTNANSELFKYNTGRFMPHKNDVPAFYGKGTVYYPDKTTIKYTGEFKNGVPYGPGKLYYPDGVLKYEGELKMGKYHTPIIFRGTWQSMINPSILYHPSGCMQFEGTFNKGNRLEGIEYHDNGSLKISHASYNWETGKLYCESVTICDKYGRTKLKGRFEDGNIVEGRKYFKNSDTIKYEGSFKDNKYHGEGTLYNKDKKIIFRGMFYNGVTYGSGYSELE